MRIGIDCRMAGTRHAGIGRYIAELLDELLKLPQANSVEWVLFFRSSEQVREVIDVDHHRGITVVIADIPHYSLTEQIVLPLYFYQSNLDLLHIPHFNVPILYRKPFLITIHDLLWHHHRGTAVTTLPQWQYWLKYIFYRIVSTSAISRAKRILVPTKTVGATIEQYYKKSVTKTVVTYEGFNATFAARQSQKKTTPKKNKLLYVGSLYPHKNIDVILDLLKNRSEYTLDIVGARSAFQETVREKVAGRGIANRVTFRGYISDAELKQAYESATALIIPSLSEGFGLPGIEALAVGTPIIASSIPIFKEVYQDAAMYFDQTSPESLHTALAELTNKKRLELHHAANLLLPRYSWKKMAKKTLQEYVNIVGV